MVQLPLGLSLSGNKLFGTSLGTYTSFGSIFSMNTDGTGYKNLRYFGGSNGKWPCNLILLSGKKLYGTTETGSSPNTYGNIFSIDTDGNNFNILYNFNGTMGSGGGDLIIVGKKLFGNGQGGKYGYGCIYCIDTNGSNYKDIFDFPDTGGDGYLCKLIQFGSRLYGMSTYGGTHSGYIYSIDTDGSAYTDIFNFNGLDGDLPDGSLTVNGTKLFGMTHLGGTSGDGLIFSIDTDGSYDKVWFNFNGTNGGEPYMGLTCNGNQVFGMTLDGGNGYGVVFRFDTNDSSSGVEQQSSIQNGENRVYPNPSNGVFTFAIMSGQNQYQYSIEIYNILGEKVYSTLLSVTPPGLSLNTINISSQANGIYFYRLKDGNGELTGEGKLIIQK